MPYISAVYKDTFNNDQYNSEETRLTCINEELNGHIPVMIRWNRRHIKFYVSGDVSIETILASFRYPALKDIGNNEKILYLTHNAANDVYENPKSIDNYSMPLANSFQNKKGMVVFWNKQNDREEDD
jgi:hypothetical protein